LGVPTGTHLSSPIFINIYKYFYFLFDAMNIETKLKIPVQENGEKNETSLSKRFN
jgi:hypothetical protein